MEVRITTCQLEADYGGIVDKDSGKHFAMKWAYINLEAMLRAQSTTALQLLMSDTCETI